MCSPSRATLLTGPVSRAARRHPHPHAGRPAPGPANTPAVAPRVGGDAERPERSAQARAPRTSAAAWSRPARSRATSPSCTPDTQTSPTSCARAATRSPTRASGTSPIPPATARCSAAGPRRTPSASATSTASPTGSRPTPARTPRPSTSAPATRARSASAGTRSIPARSRAGSAGRTCPEPFCLVVSLVNPHDVLGYPAQHVRGGYPADGFRDLGVRLPPTVYEDLRDKPSVHELMKMGMAAYLGPLRNERGEARVRQLLRAPAPGGGRADRQGHGALGDPSDPGSVRSRTLIFRCADHGEMGLSHGGLRQKAFNAYEETIHVPLVVSNPVLFPKPAQSDALVSLIDVLPTIAERGGHAARRPGQGPRPGADPRRPGRAGARSPAAHDVDLGPITAHPSPAESVQDEIHFTYDDHQAATALQDVPGQPNRIRADPDGPAPSSRSTSIPSGKKAPEYEMYDLERDPDESRNLVDRAHAARPDGPRMPALRSELGQRLDRLMAVNGTAPPWAHFRTIPRHGSQGHRAARRRAASSPRRRRDSRRPRRWLRRRDHLCGRHRPQAHGRGAEGSGARPISSSRT